MYVFVLCFHDVTNNHRILEVDREPSRGAQVYESNNYVTNKAKAIGKLLKS